MRLETIQLAKVLRFQREVTIDLRDAPAGLVAIVGPNGEGKTTVLETTPAALFRQFPSRAERELVDYTQDRDAFIEIRFAVDGQGLYVARVALDGVARKSEAVLVRVGHDGRQEILTDGKVSTFDAYVRAHFMAPEVFLASAFAAQNRAGSFITLDRKGRKDLFSKLLGLDHYEAMASTARQAAGQVETTRNKLKALHELLAKDCGPETVQTLDEQDAVARQQHAAATIRLTELKAEIARLETDLQACEADVVAYQTAQHSIQRFESELVRLNAEAGHRQREITDADDTLRAERKAIEEGLAKAFAQIDAALADITERIANNRALLDQRAEVERAQQTIREAEQAIETLVIEHAALVDSATALQASLQRELDQLTDSDRVLERQQGDLLTARSTRVAALDRAKADIALLTTVPFGPKCADAGCQFVANAAAARTELPALEAGDEEPALARIREHRGALRDRLEATRQRLRQVAIKTNVERGGHDTAVAVERDKIAAAKPLAAKAEQIAAADARITAHETSRTELLAQRPDRQADADAAVMAAEQRHGRRVTALQAQLEATLAAHTAAMAARDEARAEAQRRADSYLRAAGLRSRLAEIRTGADAALQAQTRAEAEQATIARLRRGLAERRTRLASYAERIAQLDEDLVEWQLLTKVLGREGLPVLEIDAAGPTVSQICNDLLHACFGARFSVDLITQEAKVSGRGTKETFELRVFDGQRDGAPRDLTDLSGGEQVVVDEALKSAIAAFVNQRSPMPIRTCWRDETTGALDGENAGRYVAMLRRLREIAGFHQVLFVTHNPDAALAADAQLYVEGGRVEVRLPPYAAAA